MCFLQPINSQIVTVTRGVSSKQIMQMGSSGSLMATLPRDGSWASDTSGLNSGLTKIQDVNARTTEPPGENAGVFAYLTISILYYGLPW